MSQPESENCRYCLEPLDCELGDIFDPCKCKSKVHKKCFIKWLNTRPYDSIEEESVIGTCEICNSKYKRRYRRYVRNAFNKRNLVVQIHESLRENRYNNNDRGNHRGNHRNHRNNYNQTNDSSYSCLIVWFGLFFTLMIIMSFDNNYNPNNGTDNTIQYNNTI